jgi:ubiquinone/menaquinone biosynthesis C-methylase UbiE
MNTIEKKQERKNKMENFQKEIFSSIEGDKWFERNKSNQDVYEVYKLITKYLNRNSRVLEIGCSGGKNLNYFEKTIGCECYGIDPSTQAINQGKKDYPNLNLFVGTADELNFDDEFYDFVIFGFCLCLVDRKLLPRIIAEADRVLKNKGFLAINDFDTKIPIKKEYKHYDGLKTYKYDYSSIFLSFPHYTLVEKNSFSHDSLAEKTSYSHHSNSSITFNENIDERVASVILFKNYHDGYFSF